MEQDEKWIAEFDEKFDYKPYGIMKEGKIVPQEFTPLTKENIKSFISNLITLREERAREEERNRIVKVIEGLEQSLPKTKCINAENHLFGSCFQCEKIKGFNAALSDIINQLNDMTENRDGFEKMPEVKAMISMGGEKSVEKLKEFISHEKELSFAEGRESVKKKLLSIAHKAE